MKKRTPVDRRRLGVDQITPPAQSAGRYAQRPSIMRDAHTAPVQRFDVHRPERLDRLRSPVGRQRASLPSAPFKPFFAFDFRFGAQSLVADERVQPTRKCRLGQAMLTTISPLRQPTSLPCLHVNQPPFAARPVLEAFRSHRRTSNVRRSPIWTARADLRNRAETGRLRSDHGRQDKSTASGRAHVVVWIGDFRHLACPTCCRSRLKHQRFQCPERHPSDQRKRSQT